MLRMGGVLAIDYGDRKCGFAVSDALRLSLAPLKPLRTAGKVSVLLEHLERLLAERDISTLVLGMPLHMDGSEGERARKVRGLLEEVRARFPGIEVRAWDERLTTKEAEARLREAGRSSRRARSERDSWSALVLLEDWIRSGQT